MLEIRRNSYYKINKDSSTAFITRLVPNVGAYSYNRCSVLHNAALLQKSGFVEYANCIPYQAKSKGTKNSQADAELRKVGYMDVNIAQKIGKR